MKITELALTLGNWGQPPLSTETQIILIDTYSNWIRYDLPRDTGLQFRIELYGERKEDFNALAHAIEISQKQDSIIPVLRLDPRSDRFRKMSDCGVYEIVFDIPASAPLAKQRFLANGIKQSPVFAAHQCENVALVGLRPEIALNDITRARKKDIATIVESVTKVLRPRGIKPMWRLVDNLGICKPLPNVRIPRSLASWVRFLIKDLGIDPGDISVQASNLLGMGLAGVLSAANEGAQPVCSLSGMGTNGGWAATESVLLHTVYSNLKFKKLMEISEFMFGSNIGNQSQPAFLDPSSWQIPGGTTPEKLEDKIPVFLPFDPEPALGIKAAPLLTPLSGVAGLLHLIHRNQPEKHIDSDDQRVHDIYDQLDEQFKSGRQTPVSWKEVEPVIREKGIT